MIFQKVSAVAVYRARFVNRGETRLNTGIIICTPEQLIMFKSGLHGLPVRSSDLPALLNRDGSQRAVSVTFVSTGTGIDTDVVSPIFVGRQDVRLVNLVGKTGAEYVVNEEYRSGAARPNMFWLKAAPPLNSENIAIAGMSNIQLLNTACERAQNDWSRTLSGSFQSLQTPCITTAGKDLYSLNCI